VAYGINLHGPGSLHIDAARVDALDRNVPAPKHNLPGRLGVVVQVANEKGPLARPSNLDFEDAVPADPSFREVPKDELGRTRF
jgi:hypothetical protein